MRALNYIYLFSFILLFGSCARPVANFLVEDESFTAPVKIQFKNSSKNAESYTWDFGDGTYSQDENPEHKYVLSGNYRVILEAQKGKKKNSMEKQIHVDAPTNCKVLIETNYGNMEVELYDSTPKHRDNFIKLAEEGYFNDLLFHRVIKGFMIQGGDPESRNAAPGKHLGSGGPGYQVDAEFSSDNIHIKGALAAARMGDGANPQKKSSGSQFYIVQGTAVTPDLLERMEGQKGIRYSAEQRKMYQSVGGTPFLDMEYTVFGHVVKGLDVIDKIAAVQTAPGDRPVEDVRMKIQVVK